MTPIAALVPVLVLTTISTAGGPAAPPLEHAAADRAAALACEADAACTSAAKIASEIYPKYVAVNRTIGCKIVTLATSGQVPEPKCVESAQKMEEMGRKMIASWNDMVANSWATIGPRRWDINGSSSAVSHSGTIQSLGTRLFVQEAPITSSTARVSIRKVDGNGTVTVTVCATGSNGNPTTLWTFTMDANDSDGKLWSRDFSGVKGKILSVHLVGKTPLRKLEYRVRGTAL